MPSAFLSAMPNLLWIYRLGVIMAKRIKRNLTRKEERKKKEEKKMKHNIRIKHDPVYRCKNCVYHRKIDGSETNFECRFDWTAAIVGKLVEIVPIGQFEGIQIGQYHFPKNFNPMWMAIECQGFSEVMNYALYLKDGDPGLYIAQQAVHDMVRKYAVKRRVL